MYIQLYLLYFLIHRFLYSYGLILLLHLKQYFSSLRRLRNNSFKQILTFDKFIKSSFDFMHLIIISKIYMPKGQQDLLSECGRCMLTLQKYKLKANLINSNMSKDQFFYQYDTLTKRAERKYNLIRQKVQEVMQIVQQNLLFCQATQLRVINNCFRNFRKRMGTITFQPTQFTYAKYDQSQEFLFKTIVQLNRQQRNKIKQINQQIANFDKTSFKIVQEGPQFANPKVQSNFPRAKAVLQSSFIQTHKYYEDFQRSLVGMVNQVHNSFDKFGKYLNNLQESSSSAAYNIKTKREIEIQLKKKQKQDKQKSLISNYNLEELQDILTRYPSYSNMHHEIARKISRIEKLREQQEHMKSRVGNLSNKRRNRKGISKYIPKSYEFTDWYFNPQRQKQDIGSLRWISRNGPPATASKPYQDFFDPQDQFYKKNWKQIQFMEEIKYIHRERLQDKIQAKIEPQTPQIMQKKLFRMYLPVNIQDKCWNDPIRVYTTFDEIQFYIDRKASRLNQLAIADYPFNNIQKRIYFQNHRQVQLQSIQQRRRRETIDAQKQLEKDEHLSSYRRDQNNIQIGYKILNQKAQLDQYLSFQYSDEFLPLDLDKFAPQGKVQQIIANLPWLETLNTKSKSYKKVQQNDDHKVMNTLFENELFELNQIQKASRFYFSTLEKKGQTANLNLESLPIKLIYQQNMNQNVAKGIEKLVNEYKIIIATSNQLIYLEKIRAYRNNSQLMCNFIHIDHVHISDQQRENYEKKIKSLFKRYFLKIDFYICLVDESIKEIDKIAVKIGLIQHIFKTGFQADKQLNDEEFMNAGKIILEDINKRLTQ